MYRDSYNCIVFEVVTHILTPALHKNSCYIFVILAKLLQSSLHFQWQLCECSSQEVLVRKKVDLSLSFCKTCPAQSSPVQASVIDAAASVANLRIRTYLTSDMFLGVIFGFITEY